MKPRFLLQEPIDYQMLANSYEACRWTWGLRYEKHYPSPDELRKAVSQLKDHVLVKKSTFVSSGGITVRLVNESVEVSVDTKLGPNLQYSPPPVEKGELEK